MVLDDLEFPGYTRKVAAFRRNGGNFGPEWVATFKRNGGSFAPEYAQIRDNSQTVPGAVRYGQSDHSLRGSFPS